MSVMGVNFTKMLVTKEKGARGQINVSNNIVITNVEKLKLQLGSSNQQTLKFDFSYISTYEPSVGKIEFNGEVIFLAKKEDAEKLLAEFEKTKQIHNEIKLPVLNAIVNKCTLQAIILSKDMNLPAPIPLPKVTGNTPAVAKSEEKVVKEVKKAKK